MPATSNQTSERYVQEAIEQMQTNYLSRHVRPMYFYGLVVDESNQPIVGAEVTFSKTQTGETAPQLSDPNGRFELAGVTGRYLSVEVAKTGYYATKTSRQSFDYSPEGGNFQGDSRDPVVFQLRSRGPGADLITSQYGVRPEFTVAVPKNGNPIRVDMLQRKSGGAGQLEIQSWIETDPKTFRTTSWRLRLAIPDGGFLAHQDEFPFMAPDQSYHSELVFPEPNTTNAGFGISQKTYYIRFGQPPRYGRLQISASASTGNVMLQYAINPDGSRYLEPR
jgi:hypothetical protein